MRVASLCIGAALLAASTLQASVQLDIPPRRQWDNANGYCGECTIQQIALYYGSYISQYRARAIIDPSQRQDVWVPENSGPIFEALRLRYETWNSAQPTPQYAAYLVWAKGHLQQGHPVIIDVFVAGGSDSTYDHIMPATGFVSPDATTYHATDRLIFNDNYESTPYSRTFSSLPDTRAMTGNGATYEYCIPRDVDYGCAVTGIRDDTGTTRPVSLSVDRWDEPNVSRGASPVTLNATVRVAELTAGSSYVLLRYDNPQNVPTQGFLSSAYNRAWTFTAVGSTKSLSDTFSSDALVIYRCVPASQAPAAWDEGWQDLGGGWRRLAWFGDYAPFGTGGWLWHSAHGFLFVAPGSTTASQWLYAQDMGWLWTSRSTYPYLYRAADAAWLWYNGAAAPRWFLNLSNGRWESRP